MKSINKRIVLLSSLVVILLLGSRFLPSEILNDNIKIGVSDDTSGLIVDYIIKNKEFDGTKIMEEFDTYSIKDC